MVLLSVVMLLSDPGPVLAIVASRWLGALEVVQAQVRPPAFLTETLAAASFVFAASPVSADPARVLSVLLALPVSADWLVSAVAFTLVLFVTSQVVFWLVLMELFDPGPVVISASAAAKPLKPKNAMIPVVTPVAIVCQNF